MSHSIWRCLLCQLHPDAIWLQIRWFFLTTFPLAGQNPYGPFCDDVISSAYGVGIIIVSLLYLLRVCWRWRTRKVSWASMTIWDSPDLNDAWPISPKDFCLNIGFVLPCRMPCRQMCSETQNSVDSDSTDNKQALHDSLGFYLDRNTWQPIKVCSFWPTIPRSFLLFLLWTHGYELLPYYLRRRLGQRH